MTKREHAQAAAIYRQMIRTFDEIIRNMELYQEFIIACDGGKKDRRRTIDVADMIKFYHRRRFEVSALLAKSEAKVQTS